MRFFVLILSFFYLKIAFCERIVIVAKVGNEAITSLDFDRRKVLVKLLNEIVINIPEEEAAFNKQLLEAMIDEQVKILYARELKITAQKGEIEEYIGNIKSAKSEMGQKIDEILKNADLRESFISQIETEVIWMKITSQVLAPHVKVSNEELEYQVKHKNTSKEEAYMNLANQKVMDMSVSHFLKIKQRYFIENLLP
jgi:hypothetical protein